MKFTWEAGIYISNKEVQGIINAIQKKMRKGFAPDEAITEAVQEYLDNREDGIVCCITDGVIYQIEKAIGELVP